ncbi:MAG: hypothetical protein ACYS7M_07660 [Planctomycetota bacterium]|jgi:hypothetical protein
MSVPSSSKRTSGPCEHILFDTYNTTVMPPDGFNVRVEATTVDRTQHRYMSAAPQLPGNGRAEGRDVELGSR